MGSTLKPQGKMTDEGNVSLTWKKWREEFTLFLPPYGEMDLTMEEKEETVKVEFD